MTEVLKWGENECKAGDRLITTYDPRILTITDIYSSADEMVGTSVIFEVGDDFNDMMDGEEFAYRVDRGDLTFLKAAVFGVGRMFTHRTNNDTLIIEEVAERTDFNGEYKYFVKIVNERGQLSYTSVTESYLLSCLAFSAPAPETLKLPDISVNAEFPATTLV